MDNKKLVDVVKAAIEKNAARAEMRQPGTDCDGNGFLSATAEKVWEQYAGFANRAKDACGAWMVKSYYGKTDSYGWEIDHKKPVAEGGGDDLSNLQPLQWQNNRRKADKFPWNPRDCAVTDK